MAQPIEIDDACYDCEGWHSWLGCIEQDCQVYKKWALAREELRKEKTDEIRNKYQS